MLDVRHLKAEDIQGLDAEDAARIAALLLDRVAAIDAAHGRQISERDAEIRLSAAKLQKLTFELARLKRLKFGAKTEAMTADQRRLFEETLAEDEAALQACIDALRNAKTPAPPAGQERAKRQPRRQPFPEHLRRVEHRHEPESTTCATPECGRPMVRIGEDVSERLDIVPAEFFVHRHVRGKWACKCCQTLSQTPVDPQLIDKGIPAPGLVAHVLVSRFVDHIPYYRQETINARSGVHTPRTTLASWCGAAGAELEPLGEAHRAFVLGSSVLHADETPVPMLDPGAGKTKRAYIWGYARSEFDDLRGVVYDFCVGRGAKYPAAFLAGWNGTLVCDDYKGYEPVFKLGKRIEAGCLVHARRKFEELIKNGHASPVAEGAIRRMGWIFWIEKQARAASPADRLAIRHDQTRGHWDKLHDWLRTERALVPDGSGIAAAIDYTLNRWVPLGCFLDDGNVSCHNNHLENLMRPWAMGRKAWLFAGSELAGKRAATVMSLVQSARMHGHDPWLYLRDVLSRLPTHPARDIDALLPHRWTPSQRGDGLQSVSRLSGIVARTPAAGQERSVAHVCFRVGYPPMNASSPRWKFTTRSALTLTVVAVNALGFAVWLVLAGALNAGDASGVYGMSYTVAAPLFLPTLVVVLAVDVVSLVWAIHAAVTKARSPFSRPVLLALLPWAAALAMFQH